MPGNSGAGILAIAGIIISANVAIGLLLLKNRNTRSVLSSAPVHAHHKKNESREKNDETEKKPFIE